MNAEQIEVIMRREFDATDYSELDDVMLFRSDDFSQAIKKAAAAITKKLAEKTTTEPPEPPKTVLPDMEVTRIITVKIGHVTFKRILDGSKRFEVRDESFKGVHLIRYIGPGGMRLPGIYKADSSMFRLGNEVSFDSGNRAFVRLLSGFDTETFDRLFPRTVNFFYVAPIGERLTFNDIFNGEVAE